MSAAPVHPWETGPMRDVVEEMGMVVLRVPYPLTHYRYLLSCRHVVNYPMPGRKTAACPECGEASRQGG